MAFKCKDPSLTYLNRYGYNVVKLPRAGIEPLLVLGRHRSLTPLGSLQTVWRASSPSPTPVTPNRASEIEGQKTAQLDLAIGLRMLANALAAFGATTPSLDFAYGNAKKVQFTFTDVWSVAVPPFQIGEYLASGDLNLKNPVVSRFFDDEDSTAYIITEVLKSDTVSVTATDSSGVEVAMDVPSIASVVGAKVKVVTQLQSSGVITYKGTDKITFGFKALEIAYADGRWGVIGVKPSGDMAFATSEGDEDSVVFNRGGLVTL